MNKRSLLLPLVGAIVATNAAAAAPQGQFADSAHADLLAIAQVPTRLLGVLASPAEADRTIIITPDTRYINVKHGDVVAFKANGQEFAIRFNGSDARAAFNLQRLAPAGALDHPVTAYVRPGDADAN